MQASSIRHRITHCLYECNSRITNSLYASYKRLRTCYYESMYECMEEVLSLCFELTTAAWITELVTLNGEMGANQSDTATKVDLVTRIKAKVDAADPKKARELGGVFLFNIIRGTTVYSWTMDLNKVTVYEGEPPEDPDTTITLNEHYFKLMVSGREDPRVIMQAGRCSVTGDIMRAMKLEPYIKLG